ncbi:class I adenylate-forming enzyme family protein [Aspergillus lucknowensis]|uniref:AMP-dependent synthetase/ligase domain-containing protein n=1 Tax=Aspergillus lucknowensis TaxID=176173 RepID=A0ABR4LSQ4_9EURO
MAEKAPTLPNDPILVRLLEAANRVPNSEVIIKDFVGFEKTYPELLGDVFETRRQLKSVLPASKLDERGLLREESVYITALTRTGYEYAVAFFAVRSLGGAYVPLDPRAGVERQAIVLSRAKSNCVLFDRGCTAELETLRAHVENIQSEATVKSLVVLPIVCNSPALPAMNNIKIDESLYLDPNGPGFVCMTSGTTGYSKGVVIRRTCLTSHPVLVTKLSGSRLESSEPLEKQGGAQINYNESHWLGGAKNVIESIALGKKVFALECPASAKNVLEVFRNNRITYFIFNPALLRGMKEILLGEFGGDQELTREKQEAFSVHFKGLAFFLCIGGLVDEPTVEFWETVMGLPLQNRYGASELTGLVTMGLTKIYGSVGKLSPGIEMKLSEGTHGRLLIRTPDRFLGYLGDEAATQAAFDEEGYYRTGDMAELRDGEIILLGRERDDYIVFGNSRFSALEVELRVLALPYIAEACVVAVPVEENKQLCGAVIRLKDGMKTTLAHIRADLQAEIDASMLPTVLRQLPPHEELPRTATGKPIKRQVIEDFFYDGDCGRDFFAVANPPSEVEFYGMPIEV